MQIANSSDVASDKPLKVTVDGKDWLLIRKDNDVYAMENRCPHLGWSMARGKVVDGAIVCPWHGSSFDVCTGENRDWVNSFAGMKVPNWSRKMIAMGKQPEPVKSVKLVEADGSISWPG